MDILPYLHIAKYWANRLKGKRRDFYDLYQEGVVGLLQASKKFKGPDNEFGAYASASARNKILSYIKKNRSFIQVPDYELKRADYGPDVVQVQLDAERFAEDLNEFDSYIFYHRLYCQFPDTHSDIAKVLGVSTETVRAKSIKLLEDLRART